jgi:hypothetical protein
MSDLGSLTSLNVNNKIGEEVLKVLSYSFTNRVAALSKFRSQYEVISLFEFGWDNFSHVFSSDCLENFTYDCLAIDKQGNFLF